MKTHAKVYLHISNGGVTFSVVDDGNGPEIKIESSQFGNNVIQQTLRVTKTELTALAAMFAEASYKEYSPDGHTPAKVDSIFSSVAASSKDCQGGAPPGLRGEINDDSNCGGTAQDVWPNMKNPYIPKEQHKCCSKKMRRPVGEFAGVEPEVAAQCYGYSGRTRGDSE